MNNETEIWKPIKGYEAFYQVSNFGRIKSTIFSKHKIRKLMPHRDGYNNIVLRKNKVASSHLIHRLVAIAFLPNPEGKPQVNHINGIKTDNRLENLEWNTYSENHKHAYSIGLKTGSKGEDNGCSVLNSSEVISIRKEYASGNITMRPLAAKYNVRQPTIYKIVNRITWAHL